MESTLLWLLAAALVLAGLAGTLLPVLPGIPLVFGGLALAAWIDNFQRVGWVTLIVLGSLAAGAVLIDFIAASLGAKRVGASKLALAGAMAGTIVGIFFGLIGILFGPFIGAVAGEFIARGRIGDAGKVGVATWLGLLFGTLAKIAIAFTMLGVFAASYLLG
jgi:uncharacterized protein YqgC (DUF456 family)